MSISLIQTVTVGSGGAASIDFTSIPGTYTDLMVVLSVRTDAASQIDEIDLRFNGSTASYAVRYLMGTGSGISNGTNGGGSTEIWGQTNSATSTVSTFGSLSYYVPNYAGSTNKSVTIDMVAENNASFSRQILNAAIWANSAAISSMSFLNVYGSNFVQYSSASLYGITKGSSGGVTVS